MRTIEIDDDLYTYIASQTREIGEPAAEILRRLLGLSETAPGNVVVVDAGAGSEPNNQDEFIELLGSPSFRFKPGVVDKFLFILGEAHKRMPDSFDKVLDIQGRGRKYFATSKSEIESSGNSTQPRQIPGTSYWVMTNSPTTQKVRMLRQALTAIGFDPQVAHNVAQAIG